MSLPVGFDILHPDSVRHCRRIFNALTAGRPCETRVEAIFVAKDGRKITVEGNVNCHCEDGKPILMALKTAEEALRQRTLELETQNAELDAFAHTSRMTSRGQQGTSIHL